MSYIKEIRKFIGHAPMLSAGATIVVLKQHKILLNLRSDTNTWGIPGGAIELGETLEETAARNKFNSKQLFSFKCVFGEGFLFQISKW